MVGPEARATILGHIQRGAPSTADRILSTRYGVATVEFAMVGKFGNMVALKGNKLTYALLEDIICCDKEVDADGELVQIAKAIGVCFGD